MGIFDDILNKSQDVEGTLTDFMKSAATGAVSAGVNTSDALHNAVAHPGIGSTANFGGQVIDDFLNTVGFTQRHVSEPIAGAMAKQGFDVLAPVPLPRDPLGNVSLRGLANPSNLYYVNPFGPSIPALTMLLDKAGGQGIAEDLHLPEVTLSKKMSPQQIAKIQAAPSDTAAFNVATAGHPFERMGAQAAYDPLTWATIAETGGLSGAAEGGLEASALDGNKLAEALLPVVRSLNKAHDVYNTLAGAPIEGALKGAGALLDKVPLFSDSGGLLGDAPIKKFLQGQQNIRTLLEEYFRQNPDATFDTNFDPNAGAAVPTVKPGQREMFNGNVDFSGNPTNIYNAPAGGDGSFEHPWVGQPPASKPEPAPAFFKAPIATRTDAENLVRTGDYGTISASVPGMTPEEAALKNVELYQDLKGLGYTPMPAFDTTVGNPENVFFVPYLSRDDALVLGQKYNQESVLLGNEGRLFTQDAPDVNAKIGDVYQIEGHNLKVEPGSPQTSVRLPNGSRFRFNPEIGAEIRPVENAQQAVFDEDLNRVHQPLVQSAMDFNAPPATPAEPPKTPVEQYEETFKKNKGTRPAKPAPVPNGKAPMTEAEYNDLVGIKPKAPAAAPPVVESPPVEAPLTLDELNGRLAPEPTAPTNDLSKLTPQQQWDLQFGNKDAKKAAQAALDAVAKAPAAPVEDDVAQLPEELLPEHTAHVPLEQLPTYPNLYKDLSTEQVLDGINENLGQAERHLNVPLSDRFPTLEEAQAQGQTAQQWADSILSADPNDPRFMYVSPDLREAIGKQSNLPSRVRNTTSNGTTKNGTLIKEGWNQKLRNKVLDLLNPNAGIVHPAWSKLFGGIADNAETVQAATKDLGPAVGYSEAAQKGWDALLGEADTATGQRAVRNSVTEALNTHNTNINTLQMIAHEIQTKNPTAHLSNLANVSVRDLAEQAEKNLSPEDAAKVAQIIQETFHVPDGTAAGLAKYDATVKNASRDALTESILGGTEKELKQEFGVKAGRFNAISSKYQWLMNIQRRLNLMNPAQPLRIIGDMSVKSALEGVTPETPQSVDRMASDQLGLDANSISAIRGVAARKVENGVPAEFAAGDATSKVSTLRSIPLVGKSLGKVDETFMNLNLASETAFRKAAWWTGIQRSLQDGFDSYISDIQSAAEKAGVNAESTIAKLQQAGPKFSPEDVKMLFAQDTGNGELANYASTLWSREVNDASQEGIKLANKIHFDYTDIRNADTVLKNFTLFHFWATRNIPYYAQTFADNPWLVRAAISYQQASNLEKSQMGIPGRLNGKLVSTPLPLLKYVLGEQGLAYFDPREIFSIYGQTKPRYVDTTEPLAGQAVQESERTGVSLAPWLTDALNVVGAFGNQDPENSLRATSLIQDLTGKNIEYLPERATSVARAAITGKPIPKTLSGSQLEDYYIDKRIRELALEQTGNPQDPMYTAAMGDPNNVIYKQAKRDVTRTNLFNDLLSMVSPVPVGTMSKTEGEIRQAAGQLAPNLSPASVSTLELSNDPATAYWNMPQNAQEAQIRGAQAVLAYFGNDQKSNPQFMDALDGTFPAYQQYEAWASSQPAGANVTVDAFTHNLVSTGNAQNIYNTAAKVGMSPADLAAFLQAQYGVSAVQDISAQQYPYVIQAIQAYQKPTLSSP